MDVVELCALPLTKGGGGRYIRRIKGVVVEREFSYLACVDDSAMQELHSRRDELKDQAIAVLFAKLDAPKEPKQAVPATK